MTQSLWRQRIRVSNTALMSPSRASSPTEGADAPVVVTMGDSTSQHLTPAMVELAAQNGFTLIQAGLGGCSLDDRKLAGGGGDNRFRPVDKRCLDAYEPIMEAVIAGDPDLIVAATRNTATRHVGPDGELVEPLTEQHLLDVTEATGATLDRLIEDTDAQIVLIDTLPRLGDVDCLAANEQNPTVCDTAADAGRSATYNELVRELAAQRPDRVSVISLRTARVSQWDDVRHHSRQCGRQLRRRALHRHLLGLAGLGDRRATDYGRGRSRLALSNDGALNAWGGCIYPGRPVAR